MTKQSQAAEGQADKKGRPRTNPVVIADPAVDLLDLGKLPGGPGLATAGGEIEGQVARLGDARLQIAQRQALAAEVGRVQGNRHLQRVVTSINANDHVVQRENGEEEENPFQLQMPSSFTPGALGPGPSLGSELRLDPTIQARMRVMQFMLHQLDPSTIRPALLELDPGPLAQSHPAFAIAPPAPEEPLVPTGAGPSQPREGTAGDVVRAIVSIPAVDQALTNLREQALDRVEHDWRRLSTGEQIAAVSVAVLIGGGALAGAISDPSARRFMLDQLNGRVLPVPGVTGLSVELNTERDNLMLGLHLDVGALLPESWGFGPSSPTAIGGPPSPVSGPASR